MWELQFSTSTLFLYSVVITSNSSIISTHFFNQNKHYYAQKCNFWEHRVLNLLNQDFFSVFFGGFAPIFHLCTKIKMLMIGYVMIYKSIQEWGWYKDSAIFHLFVHLILNANFKDCQWRDKIVRRGQLVTSRNSICQATGLTEKVVRGALVKLQKTGEIIVETTNKYSVITICNYDRYQGQYEMEGQQKASKRPRNGQQRATKEQKNKENNVTGSSLRSDSPTGKPLSLKDDQVDHLDYDAFHTFFNERMKGKAIPCIIKMNSKRKNMLRARCNEYGKEALATVVRKAAESSFLNGGSGRFKADFDWLFGPQNFLKVLEGKYDNSITNYKSIKYGTNINNGYRSREDIYAGGVKIISELRSGGDAPQTDIPVV